MSERLRRGLNLTLAASQRAKRALLGERLQLRRFPRLLALYERLVTGVRNQVLSGVHGEFTLHLDPQDALRLSLYGGVYEPAETRFASSCLRPGDCVLDLGAHIGYFSLLFAQRVGPTGSVYAYEPSPTNYALLTRNVEVNAVRTIHCQPLAAAEQSGELGFYLDAHERSDNRSYAPPGAGAASLRVQAVRLDEHLPSLGVEQVDFVKLDLQGAELSALRGLRQTLARSPRATLLVEFWPRGQVEAGESPEALLDLGAELGFEVCELSEEGVALPLERASLLERCTPANGAHVNLVWRRPGSGA